VARRGQTTDRVHHAAPQRRVRFDQADLNRRCRQALAKIAMRLTKQCILTT
jgi:primosomal protein N''